MNRPVSVDKLLEAYIFDLKDTGCDYIPVSIARGINHSFSATEHLAISKHQPEQLPGESLEEIKINLGDCTRCRLSSGRKCLVFGCGNPNADIVFVGEGPGRDEDEQGEPFVGAAGKLLTRIIAAMGLKRDDVYICNVVKCRPPDNRDPLPDEIKACSPFLFHQIKAVSPKVIVALGRFASQTLLCVDTQISSLRGRFFDFNGTPLMPTYHPSALLHNEKLKRPVWDDMKKVMEFLGLPLQEK